MKFVLYSIWGDLQLFFPYLPPFAVSQVSTLALPPHLALGTFLLLLFPQAPQSWSHDSGFGLPLSLQSFGKLHLSFLHSRRNGHQMAAYSISTSPPRAQFITLDLDPDHGCHPQDFHSCCWRPRLLLTTIGIVLAFHSQSGVFTGAPESCIQTLLPPFTSPLMPSRHHCKPRQLCLTRS